MMLVHASSAAASRCDRGGRVRASASDSRRRLASIASRASTKRPRRTWTRGFNAAFSSCVVAHWTARNSRSALRRSPAFNRFSASRAESLLSRFVAPGHPKRLAEQRLGTRPCLHRIEKAKRMAAQCLSLARTIAIRPILLTRIHVCGDRLRIATADARRLRQREQQIRRLGEHRLWQPIEPATNRLVTSARRHGTGNARHERSPRRRSRSPRASDAPPLHRRAARDDMPQRCDAIPSSAPPIHRNDARGNRGRDCDSEKLPCVLTNSELSSRKRSSVSAD